MNRRKLLKWICRCLGAACTFVIAAPGIGYVISPLLRRKKKSEIVQRLAKVKDIPVDRPRLFAIVGNQRDAWTVYPQQTIGRVWLVRKAPAAGKEEDYENAQVEAFTSICPHLGCEIKLEGDDRFVCPCHQAVWDTEGRKVSEQELKQKNPTPRGMDKLKWTIVKDETDDWWVEVTYEKFEFGRTDQVVKS